MSKKIIILLIIPLLVIGCKDEHLLDKTTREEDVLVITAEPGKTVSRTSSHTPLTQTTSSTDAFGTLPAGKTTKKTTTKAGNKTTTSTKASTNRTILIKDTTKKTTVVTNKLSSQEKSIYDKLIALKKKYPEGTSWGEDKLYEFKAKNEKGRLGRSCAAFAYLISDLLFGDAPVTKITDFKKYTPRVGDILRSANGTHSSIILGVTKNSVILVEGNVIINGGKPIVHWGREISRTNTSTWEYIWTRY